MGPTTGTMYEPRVNLCTGEMTGSLALTIKGSTKLAGATVFVDGKPTWRLSNTPDYSLTMGISTGPHEIRVEKDGFEPIEIAVDFELRTKNAEIDLPEPNKKG